MTKVLTRGGLLTITPGCIKVGMNAYEIGGGALDALQLAEVFVQVFSASQIPDIRADGGAAANAGMLNEARAVSVAIGLWSNAEAAYGGQS